MFKRKYNIQTKDKFKTYVYILYTLTFQTTTTI